MRFIAHIDLWEIVALAYMRLWVPLPYANLCQSLTNTDKNACGQPLHKDHNREVRGTTKGAEGVRNPTGRTTISTN